MSRADERCWQIIGFVWFAETHAIEFLHHSLDEVAWGCPFAGCALRHAVQPGMRTWHLSGLGGYRLDTAAWIPPQCWYAKLGAQGGTHGNGHFSDAYPALRADHIGGRPIPVLMAKTLSFFLCSLQTRYEACVCGLGRPYLDLHELWNWIIPLENFTCTRSQTRCVFSVDILCVRPTHQAEPSTLRLQQRVPKATAVQNSPTR